MSEILTRPTNKDYDSVVYELDQTIESDYFDARGAVEALKFRHRLSHSFFQLATSASKAALYFEEFTDERKLADPTMARAKAFMRGIFIAEMVNERLFREEHHNTAFTWLTAQLSHIATMTPEYATLHPKDVIQRQFYDTGATFMANFEDSTKAVMSRWAWQLAEPAYIGEVKVAMGAHLSAGYSYHSHKVRQREETSIVKDNE
jgi:hypothetical protein